MAIFAKNTNKTMRRKAEERERRRERNQKRAENASCVLGIALMFDILIFLIAALDSNV